MRLSTCDSGMDCAVELIIEPSIVAVLMSRFSNCCSNLSITAVIFSTFIVFITLSILTKQE